MEINYAFAGAVALIAILLLAFLMIRNRKDQKDFEEDLNHLDSEPENHQRDEERL